MGNGNRTRNRRSHSPVLCQLSYSHRHGDYSNCGSGMSEAARCVCRAPIGLLLLRRKATPNGVNQMSKREVRHPEEGRGKTIDNSRERRSKAEVRARPPAPLFGTGEFFVHGSWVLGKISSACSFYIPMDRERSWDQLIRGLRQRTQIPWRGAG